MASTAGSRRRTGCTECRKRKQRCDEAKPSCHACQRRGAKCCYPDPSLITPSSFVVIVAGSHPILPLPERSQPLSLVNLNSDQLGQLCSQYAPSSALIKPDGLTHSDPSAVPALLPTWSWDTTLCDAVTETSLIQYYVEVIGNSRVYVPTVSNIFLHAVLPVLLQGQGSVRSMILAMSAVEWSKAYPDYAHRYAALADCYKVQALHLLRDNLQNERCAEENLLTCILLASMDISQGSRSSWLHHIRGAVAILHSLGNNVSTPSTTFALRYAQFRYILMSTTRSKRIYLPGTSDPAESSATRDEVLIGLAAARMATGKYDRELVDPQLGCSIEMLDYICQTSILEGSSVSSDPSFSADDQKRMAGLRLESKIKSLPIEVLEDVDDYLRNSAECFRNAALIYLYLVIFHLPASHSKVACLLDTLLGLLSTVINQRWSRRSFPMWPLFIAGCTSLFDPQRKAILELFDVIEQKWPVSNIYTVREIMLAIWHTRDLHADVSGSTQPDDWQNVIEKFGWKLSLS